MKRKDWLEAVRKHLALGSVGASTLRGQSTVGQVKRAREFLRDKVLLTDLERIDHSNFAGWLNAKTKELAKLLPRPTDDRPNFGASRKVLSIFLRLCAMNKDLHRRHKLGAIESFLEVPLDSNVVAKIDEKIGSNYGRKFVIRELTPALNSKIQKVATRIALTEKLHRYELDVLYWGWKPSTKKKS